MATRSHRKAGRGTLIVTNDPNELRPPRLDPSLDVGWAVSELFEAAWIASGRDPRELRRSIRTRRVTRRR